MEWDWDDETPMTDEALESDMTCKSCGHVFIGMKGYMDFNREKYIATRFFRWWYNQPGQNTDAGYDDWVEQGRPR